MHESKSANSECPLRAVAVAVTAAAPPTTTTTTTAAVSSSSIFVAVRKRAKIAHKESDENDVVRCEAASTVVVYEPKTKLDLTPVIEPSIFNFDRVFDEEAPNAEVYETCCRPLLENVKGGGGAVVFAFGQTGSGKTYTLLGRAGVCQGLYTYTVAELLAAPRRVLYTLCVSFYEVYGSKLFDLLNGRTEVKMLQDECSNIRIIGLSERTVASEEEMHQIMSDGQQLRSSGMTHANDRSSRSHAVLEIKLRVPGEPNCGRITFVDLAGSERAADTADTDIKVRREGAEINKSLLALKECIRAMSLRRKHIPFRVSKLTQILRESFLGRCKTCVIANISPCQRHCEDTINTLRYADRIKELKSPTGGALETLAPMPCLNCGLPVFLGDRHVCLRVNVHCPHCRQEMDKPQLEMHLNECKDCPIRCPQCNERFLRSELQRHNRRCRRVSTVYSSSTRQVVHKTPDKIINSESCVAKDRCRRCAALFPRSALPAHESDCEMIKVTCAHCARCVLKGRMEAHLLECVRNRQRKRFSSLDQIRQPPQSTLEQEPHTKYIENEQEKRLPPVKPPRSFSTSALRQPSAGTAVLRSAHVRADECATTTLTVCPYARYGCTSRAASANSLSTHLLEAIARHLQLAAVYADKMEAENVELRRFINAIKRN